MYTLDRVVPWGRSCEEYRRMFALTDSDLRKHILGCGDGPASFNAELTATGGTVTSCDPLYRYSAEQIRRRIDDASPTIIEQARINARMFVWSDMFADPNDLARHRWATMERFLDDYEQGRTEGRYLSDELPTLPFAENAFGLALCSHFLFLYSEQLSERFHLDAVRNLIGVAPEVRIFPINDLAGTLSRHVQPVTTAFHDEGYHVVIETVNYEFQKGANQMMRITR